MAHIAIDAGRVRPVGLHGHDGEAVPLDQPPGDRGAGAIEFRRAVRRLAEHDDARVRAALSMSGAKAYSSARSKAAPAPAIAPGSSAAGSTRGADRDRRSRDGRVSSCSAQPSSPMSGTKRTAPRLSSLNSSPWRGDHARDPDARRRSRESPGGRLRPVAVSANPAAPARRPPRGWRRRARGPPRRAFRRRGAPSTLL